MLQLASAREEPESSSEQVKESGEDGADADAVPDLNVLTEMIQTPQYHARPFQVGTHSHATCWESEYIQTTITPIV